MKNTKLANKNSKPHYNPSEVVQNLEERDWIYFIMQWQSSPVSLTEKYLKSRVCPAVSIQQTLHKTNKTNSTYNC